MDRFIAPQPKRRLKKEVTSVSRHEAPSKKPVIASEAEEMNGPTSTKDYACVGPEAIAVIAESIGLPNIGNEVAISLAEDVSYRLQEIINASCTFMRTSKRRKLLTSDVNSAFRTSNVNHIFGHSQKAPTSFLRLPEGELFVTEDHEVDLISFVRSSDLPRLKKHSYVATSYPVLQTIGAPSMNGLSSKTEASICDMQSQNSGFVNGDIKLEASFPNTVFESHNHLQGKSLDNESLLLPEGSKKKSYSMPNGPQSKSALNSYFKSNGAVSFASHPGVIEKLKRDSEGELRLSEAQKIYFNFVVKCIIEGHHTLYQQALLSLRRSKKAQFVSASLLNFVALSVCHIPRHYGFLLRLLETVEVLLCNVHISPAHSIAVNRLINALLAVIADQNVLRGKNDFHLRRKAAQILSKVFLVWGIEEQHVSELLSRVARVLGDAKEKIQSHFAALVIFQSLGRSAIGWLSPMLKCFMPILEKRLSRALSSVEFEEMRGVLLDIVEILFCEAHSFRFKIKASTLQEMHAMIHLDTLIYQFCGDAVCARRRPSYFNCSPNKRKQSCVEEPQVSNLDCKSGSQGSNHVVYRFVSHYPQKADQNLGNLGALEEMCVTPVFRRKDIQFKFAGANPVPKDILRKKVLHKTHLQFASPDPKKLKPVYPTQYLIVGRIPQGNCKTKKTTIPYNLLTVL